MWGRVGVSIGAIGSKMGTVLCMGCNVMQSSPRNWQESWIIQSLGFLPPRGGTKKILKQPLAELQWTNHPTVWHSNPATPLIQGQLSILCSVIIQILFIHEFTYSSIDCPQSGPGPVQHFLWTPDPDLRSRSSKLRTWTWNSIGPGP